MADVSPPLPDPAPDSSADSVDPLDAGMQAAFPPMPSSVLQALQQTLGPLSQVSLREAAPEIESEAIVKPVAGGAGRSRLTARYHLIGEIARGGVGIVLRGHDVDLGRDVAIKVLQDKYQSSPPVLQRFLEEAQLGGQLQHPGIVPVYELGVHDGRPFFAMKLVKGRTLASVLTARTDLKLERASLLGTFERVCQTIAYAHARGVIHRDLKPANVMVGSFGEVQVVDWGMAKVLKEGGVADERRATASHVSVIETVRSQPGSSGSQSVEGSVMGTPAYMPPEQALGRVDAMDQRSDVFSLGAILCEILTGRPPYPDHDSALLLAAACRTEDVLADLAKCGADGELVALATECLQADPKRRPAHAGVLADRVHGHLASQDQRAQQAQVEAAEARVRAEDAKRAQKLTLGLAAAVVLAMCVGGGAWFMVHHQQQQVRERDRIAMQKSRGELEQHVAAAAASGTDAAVWARALATCDQLATNLVDQQLDPEVRSGIEQRIREVRAAEANARATAARLAADQQMLERLQEIGIPNAEAIAQSEPGSHGGEAIHRVRGYEEELRRFGIDVLAGDEIAVAASVAATSIAPDLAAALDDWAMALRKVRKDPSVQQRLLRIAQLADPADPWRTKLRELLMAGAENKDNLRDLVVSARRETLAPITWLVLGQALAESGADEAVADLYRAARDAHPRHFRIALQLGLALARLGSGVHDERIGVYHQALGMRPDSLMALHGLATSMIDAGRRPEAIVLLRKEVAMAPNYGLAHRNLGVALGNTGDWAAAEAAIREALRLRPQQAEWWSLLCWSLQEPHRFREGLEAADHAIALDGQLGAAHFNRGASLDVMGDLEAASASFREAVRHSPDNVSFRSRMARYLWKIGEQQESRQQIETAIHHVVDDEDELKIAESWAKMKDWTAAAAAARRAVALAPGSVAPLANFGWYAIEAGQLAAASEVLSQVIAIDADCWSASRNLSVCEDRQGQTDKAEARLIADLVRPAFRTAPREQRDLHRRRLTAVLNRHGPSGIVDVARRLAQQCPDVPEVYALLGDSLIKAGDTAASIAPLRRAVELDRAQEAPSVWLAESLLALDRIDDALAACDAGLVANPWSASLHQTRSRVLQHGKRMDEAIAALDEACRLERRNGVLYAQLHGLLRTTRGLRGEAAYWQAFVEARPLSPAAWQLLGIARADQGDLAGALPCYERAIAQWPDRYDAWSNLGHALLGLGKLDDARAAFERALAIDPLQPKIHTNLARLAEREQRWEDAGTHFLRVVELSDREGSDVKPIDAAHDLDKFWFTRLGPVGALEAWQAFTTRNPRHAVGFLRLGSAYERLGRPAEAAAAARSALEIDPGSWIVRNDLGAYLINAGNAGEAVAILTEAKNIAPAQAFPRANLARAFTALEEWDDAVREAVEAVALQPNAFCERTLEQALAGIPAVAADKVLQDLANSVPHDGRLQVLCARRLSKLGRFAAAEPIARKAVQSVGGSPEHALLGDLLEELGNLEEAEHHLRTALKGKNCPIQALHSLGHVLEKRGFAVAGLAELEQFNKLVADLAGIKPCEHIARVREKARVETENLAILDGTAASTDAGLLLRAAKLGYDRGRHARMVEITQQAFTLEPTIAEDLAEFWRYNGACSAAMAAAALPAEDPVAKQLRSQARTWILADLAAREKAAAIDDGARQVQLKQFRWWLEDGDLTSMRAIEQLPETERAEMTALWIEVRAALDRLTK